MLGRYLTLLALFALIVSSLALTRDEIIDAEAKLDILEYEDNRAFLEKLRARKEPVLLKGTPAQTGWNALNSWAPRGESPNKFYLSERSKRPIGVKRHNHAKFPIGCCELKPMTQKEFWTTMSELKEGEYMYLNGNLDLFDATLQQDVEPVFFSSFKEHLGDIITNVWMGSKGSTAALHHDPFDNFFVQIYGSKRFTLFPPDAHSALHVYPKTHPASRQSQVNINRLTGADGKSNSEIPDSELEKWPLLNEPIMKNSGLEFIVHPGDVIYLPPFWFHQVESLENAISVNTWFKSPDVERMDLAWTEPLPFLPDWSDEGFLLGAKEYISTMIYKVLGSKQDSSQETKRVLVKEFVTALIDSRFKPLYGPEAPISVDILKGIKSLNDPHLRVHMREQEKLDEQVYVSKEALSSLRDICSLNTDIIFEEDVKLRPQFEKMTNAAKDHFLGVENLSGLQLIHLNDFVEDIIGQVVGDKSVYHFLQNCMLVDVEEIDEDDFKVEL